MPGRAYNRARSGEGSGFLEYRILDLPSPSGSVRLAGDGWFVAMDSPGHGLRPLPGHTDATVDVTFDGFQGECGIRLYCDATIAADDGPRGFWLPDWR